MITKLTWQTEPPTKPTHAIIIVKAELEPNFITIAEYEPEDQTWFETGGLNLHLGGYEIIRWADLKTLPPKLFKE
jgi:hypothetical protein